MTLDRIAAHMATMSRHIEDRVPRAGQPGGIARAFAASDIGIVMVIAAICLIPALAGPAAAAPGAITTLVGPANLSAPAGVAVDPHSRDALIADPGLHRVLRINARSGAISVAAGTGIAGFNGD